MTRRETLFYSEKLRERLADKGSVIKDLRRCLSQETEEYRRAQGQLTAVGCLQYKAKESAFVFCRW